MNQDSPATKTTVPNTNAHRFSNMSHSMMTTDKPIADGVGIRSKNGWHDNSVHPIRDAQ